MKERYSLMRTESRIMSLKVRAMAVRTEVDAMKTRNRLDQLRDEEPTYSEHDFREKAEELEKLASDIAGLAVQGGE
jgi:hypothetical protein